MLMPDGPPSQFNRLSESAIAGLTHFFRNREQPAGADPALNFEQKAEFQ